MYVCMEGGVDSSSVVPELLMDVVRTFGEL